MKQVNNLFDKKDFNFSNQDDIKKFWKSHIWKLEIKKNICTLSTIILNLIIAILNITIFSLLITAIILLSQKVSDPNFNHENNSLTGIVFLITLSVALSLGIIFCSFILISMKNKNKFKIYQKICFELDNLLINYIGDNIEAEIIKIIDENMIFKKEKLFKSLKSFVSEDKIKWS